MNIDQLERDNKGQLIRTTNHKLLIHGQYHEAEEDLEFSTREQGLTGTHIKIKFHGHYPLKRIKNHFIWNYCELNKKETRKLIRWLIEKEKDLK